MLSGRRVILNVDEEDVNFAAFADFRGMLCKFFAKCFVMKKGAVSESYRPIVTS